MYRLVKEEKKLVKMPERDFAELGIKERFDIEEWVEKDPNVLGEELLIIAKEFAGFDRTNERLDLLALDTNGNIVVIELKRDDSGKSVDWQAIKYASYCAQLSAEEIVEIYAAYKEISREQAAEVIESFIGATTIPNENQRIILLAKSFRPEVTSSVMWLLDKGIHIKCVEIKPFLNELTREVYVNFNVILPPPETEQYIIRKARVEREQSEKRESLRSYTVESHLERVSPEIGKLFHDLSWRIKSLGSEIQEVVTSEYIAYRNRRNFVEIYLKKTKIAVFIRTFDGVENYPQCERKPDSYGWTLNVKVTIDSEEDIEPALEVIRKSYETV